MEAIKYEDFAKLDLRVATILEVKPHPNADKLLILKVSLGTEGRQIVAGIRKQYENTSLVGSQIVIVANLEPRALRGEMSHGMLLAASDASVVDLNGISALSLLTTDKKVESGSKVG